MKNFVYGVKNVIKYTDPWLIAAICAGIVGGLWFIYSGLCFLFNIY